MLKFLCPIYSHARLRPRSLAIKESHRTLTYFNLNEAVEKARAFILKNYKGKKIGLIAKNSSESLILYFGALRAHKEVFLFSDKEPKAHSFEEAFSLDIPLIDAETCFLPARKEKKDKPRLSKRAIASYIFTSGSSAKPKICALTIENHFKSAVGCIQKIKLNHQSKYLMNLPLYHVSGISIPFRVFSAGGTCIFPKQGEALEPLLKEETISHLSMVSTQLRRWLKNCSTLRFPHLKMVLLGGGFFSSSLLDEAIKHRLPIYLSYGLTEMSSTVTLKKIDQIGDYFLGRSLPSRSLFLSRTGEIVVSGSTLFKGYYSKEQKKILHVGRFYFTSDFGQLNEKGELTLDGRKDRRIISGGEKIYPEEIETLLESFPNILRSYVIFYETNNEIYQAAAFIDSIEKISISELKTFLASKLPSFKIPKAFYEWPQDLKSFTNKLSKETKEALNLLALSLKNQD